MSSPQQSVPPAQSSHTAEGGTDTGRVIRIPRLAHLGVFILLFCAAFPFFGWPAVLWILFLIPIAAAWWVERSRTTVSAGGLDLRTIFGTRHVDWSQIQGLRIPKRGWVRAHLSDDSEVALPAVSYDRLKDLIAASDGRIPDPFARPAKSAASADEKSGEQDPSADTGAESGGADSASTDVADKQDTSTDD
ncbi:Low molecular weight protein antigen 6 [Nocardia cerradoensis]|uniref:Low molecular weight protein antigen 6 n=1 Tax=Nocardia cerradoensis TaxID=85688 RepID=A0A231HEK6_9NOCA|nr:PH domain-containing protein [Nocardia cerradoensis]OXR47401.1 Low molecular weight protein antigen 6 [Nocardia cerradoensis]